MRPSEAQFKSLVQARLEKAPALVRQKSSKLAWNFLWDDTRGLCKLADREVCEQRHQYFSLPDKNPEDYSEKLLDLGDGNFAIAGIRFKKLDPSFPYVEVHPNHFIEAPKQIKAIALLVEQVYSKFKPKGLILNQIPEGTTSLRPEIWNQNVIGEVETLKTNRLEGPYPELILEIAEDPIDYELYRQQFGKWIENGYGVEDFSFPRPKDDFYFSCQQGLYYLVKIDGQLAGIISAREDRYYGIPCIFVIERLLFEEYSFEQYTPVLQHHFFQKLPDSAPLVWEVIHNQNQLILQSALAAGCFVADQEYFFSLG